MAKKVVGIVKLAINAGKATPAPPVGPALGGYGINMMEFIKGYNAKTADMVGSIVRSSSPSTMTARLRMRPRRLPRPTSSKGARCLGGFRRAEPHQSRNAFP
jgi:hypothetical protein